MVESALSRSAHVEERVTTVSQATLAPPQPAAVVERYGRLVSSICWRMTSDQDAARDHLTGGVRLDLQHQSDIVEQVLPPMDHWLEMPQTAA
jgi:hypothetical protein